MAVSDDFKEQLKAGKLVEALTLVLTEAVELEITTWVASGNSGADNLTSDQPQPGSRMRTRINILEGEIDNEVGSEFIGNGSYTELQKFHQQQVQQGRQTIQNNLIVLQQMFTVLASTMSQIPSGGQPKLEENSVLPPSNQKNLY